MSEFTKNVQDWASEISEIRAVILFGSRARGDWLPGSDWDICILLDAMNVENGEWYGTWFAYADLWHESFCKKVGLEKAEVQFTAPTSKAVKNGIARSSKILYVKDVAPHNTYMTEPVNDQ
ncbi:nucleotidyltransferase domain-containing protein [Teredinibacter sp. KSP-S5-2]|uniref:nucleotidyltransferase domain-containing protein n=1 Tax=Teredinibacter sp. KSP-S5-2 TaxID=3034506 RepID=UPI002934BC60|nr:nucleotidyltransferase domain-containing protein [Teredinibacter sp. KSP-S5-2]WNO10482.1 nucleotidyltransferase domain-containing protein [Teredinibacter sp. KSP-S5-2]